MLASNNFRIVRIFKKNPPLFFVLSRHFRSRHTYTHRQRAQGEYILAIPPIQFSSSVVRREAIFSYTIYNGGSNNGFLSFDTNVTGYKYLNEIWSFPENTNSSINFGKNPDELLRRFSWMKNIQRKWFTHSKDAINAFFISVIRILFIKIGQKFHWILTTNVFEDGWVPKTQSKCR